MSDGAAVVQINLYSGLANPSWPLPMAEAMKLRATLLELPVVPAIHITGQLHQAGPPWLSEHGYRGFELRFPTMADGPAAAFYVFRHRVYEALTGLLRQDNADVTIEEQLYRTAPAEIVQLQLGGMSFAALNAPGHESRIRGLEGPSVPLQCADAPAFPGTSGTWRTHRLDNNCYNYATNVLNTDPLMPPAFPGPGELTQAGLVHLKHRLHTDMLADTGTQLPSHCPPQNSHYLAVVLRRHPSGAVRDFHCLRLDSNGAWSHKDGNGFVRRTDDTGQPMTDLTQVTLSWDPELVGIYIMDSANRNRIK